MGEITTGAAASPAELARRVGFLVAGLPLGLVAFAVAVAGLVVGAATAVLWVGLPVLRMTLRGCGRLAGVERRAVEGATGRALPPHHYRGRPLGDPQAWRDLLHAVVALPVRVVVAVAAGGWAVLGVAGALAVTWEWSLRPADRPLALALGVGSPAAALTALTTAAGALLLLTLPLVVRTLVTVRASLAQALLTNPVAALRARPVRRSAGGATAPAPRVAERRAPSRQRLLRMDRDLQAALHHLADEPAPAPQE